MFIRSLQPSCLFAEDAGGGAAPPAAPAFAETLPEAIRGEAAFKDIKDLGTLASSYLSAQKIAGDPNAYVKLPTGSEDAAAWDAVYNKLGRPEAADKYTLKMPDGAAIDDTLKGGFQSAAHKAGVTQAQAQALFDWYNGAAASAATQSSQQTQARVEAGIQSLRTDWGAAFDANLALANQAIDHYGGTKLVAELQAGGLTGLGNSPELARVLARIGQGLKEDGLVGRGSGGAGDVLSPAEAQQQINALQTDKTFTAAYMDRRHPGHAEAVTKMSRLYEFKTARPA